MVNSGDPKKLILPFYTSQGMVWKSFEEFSDKNLKIFNHQFFSENLINFQSKYFDAAGRTDFFFCPVFEWDLKSRLFRNRPTFEYSKSGRVQILDPHGGTWVAMQNSKNWLTKPLPCYMYAPACKQG